MRRSFSVVLLALILITCRDRDPAAVEEIKEIKTGTCADRGPLHTGVIPTEQWRAADSPHFLNDSVLVAGTLEIEPGALVCAHPGAILSVRAGRLMAVATAEQPIRFVAVDPVRPWLGIETDVWGGNAGTAILKHVLLEWASKGVRGSLRIEDSHLRQSSVYGFDLYMLRTVIDTGNVGLSGGVWQDNLIRNGSLRVSPHSLAPDIIISGGRIENSPDTAIIVWNTKYGNPPEVHSSKPLRIIGSGGDVAVIPVSVFQRLWPSREWQDSLLGNGNGRIVLGLTASTPPFVLRRGLSWKLTLPGYTANPTVDGLTLESGVNLEFATPRLDFRGPLIVMGTRESPVHMRAVPPSYGITLSGTAQSRLSNVALVGLPIAAVDQHTIAIDHLTTDAAVVLASPASTLTDATIHDVTAPPQTARAALRLAGAGIRAERIVVRRTFGSTPYPTTTPLPGVEIAADGVQLQSCEITDNASDGVRISAGANIRIQQCNLERNGGFGVNNVTSVIADARGNWWGDPTGPDGITGDGVAGAVDSRDHLTAPLPSTTTARTLTVNPGSATVATADTIRLMPAVRDAGGNVLGAEPVIWRIADTTVVTLDPSSYGVLVGVRAASTAVELIARNDTTVRAVVPITVTPGGPYYHWTREPLPNGGYASTMWGSSANDLYAVVDSVFAGNSAREVIHYDGSRWAPVAGVVPGGYATVAGTSSKDVYVQGRGVLMHFDGSAWAAVADMPANAVTMWAAAPQDVFMTASNSTIWRFRNGVWSQLPANASLGPLWGRSGDDVYLGNSGRVLHWDGGSWQPLPPVNSYYAITGTANSIYVSAAGSFDGPVLAAYRYDGSRWTHLPGQLPRDVANAIAAASDSLVVATWGRQVAVYDGRRFWPVWTGERDHRFWEIWIDSDEIFLAGVPGYILHGRRK